MIDHRKATRKNIASRYVLGELTASEREEFEAHFFDCAECAEQVSALLAICSNAEAVLSRVPDRAPANSGDGARFSWLEGLKQWRPRPALLMAPLCAFVVLAGIATRESMALRRQLNVQSVAAFTLRPDTRGDENVIVIPAASPFFVLTADVPGMVHELKWQIRGADSQANLLVGTAPSPPLGSPLTLLIPASKLRSGCYILSIRGDVSPAADPTQVVYRFRMH